MPLLDWDPSYRVDIDDIDDQHWRLFDCVKRIEDSLNKGVGPNITQQVIEELTQYALEHFAAEEQLFAQFDYDEADHHKALHGNFCVRLEEFKSLYSQATHPVDQNLFGYLKAWLRSHVLVDDKRYADAIRAKHQVVIASQTKGVKQPQPSSAC